MLFSVALMCNCAMCMYNAFGIINSTLYMKDWHSNLINYAVIYQENMVQGKNVTSFGFWM